MTEKQSLPKKRHLPYHGREESEGSRHGGGLQCLSPLLTLMKSVNFSWTCGMLLIGISHFLTLTRGGRSIRVGSHGEGGRGILRHQQSTKGGLENLR